MTYDDSSSANKEGEQYRDVEGYETGKSPHADERWDNIARRLE